MNREISDLNCVGSLWFLEVLSSPRAVEGLWPLYGSHSWSSAIVENGWKADGVEFSFLFWYILSASDRLTGLFRHGFSGGTELL